MPWPLSQDYNEAIQTPAQCFSDLELQRGEAVTNELGLPMPCSGNFADVYAVQAGQQKWAVKCFTRQIQGLRERYAEISKYLHQVQLPFMVEFKFLDQGIRVRGQWYPILKMQWVEGLALNTFVRANVENPAILQSVCQIWVRMAARLREANLAHGDLQHGNVLLVQGAKAGTAGVKLVDYDGMCVPALEFLKATEVGHPAYQHPQRLREASYGLHIDNFSHLVIYTALRALTVGGKKLWDRFDNGDNLLFSQKDFENPNASPVFKELLAQTDGEVRKLTGALAEAARQPVKQVPQLEVVLPNESRPKTAIPKPTAPKAAEPNPFVPPDTPARPRKKQGGKGVLAAVLIGCLVMAGVAVGAYLLMQGPPPPSSSLAVNDSKRGAAVPSTKAFVPQTTPLGTLDGKVVGTYRLNYSRGTESNSSTIRFTDDHKMFENSAEKGTWAVAGSTIIVTYNDPQWGKAELAFKDEDTVTGQHKHGNGAIWSWVLKKELTGERLARRVVGTYRLKYSRGTESNSSTIRFDDDRKMIENGAEKGMWAVAGSTVSVTYNDPQWGKAELAFKDEDTLTGQHKHGNGAVWYWTATKTAAPSPTPIKQATTCLIRNLHSGMYLYVLGSSTKAGDGVGQWPETKVRGVVWKIEPANDGSCRILNLHSNMYLDVTGASTKAGAGVGQWPDPKVKSVVWKIEPANDGSCRILNLHSNMYLDVTGASTKAGDGVGQWPDPKVKSVVWKIEPVSE
ncbi:MAG: RICIN domain-containing protein [Gemmataceae bacterium]|nr:RICIN domain-containing protein [Gemmataceae bacterium]